MKSHVRVPDSATAVPPPPLAGMGPVATGDRGLGTRDSRPEGGL
jgi:hypothetical protein